MLSTYNDPSCVLTGKSMNTKRIERMWHDIYTVRACEWGIVIVVLSIYIYLLHTSPVHCTFSYDA